MFLQRHEDYAFKEDYYRQAAEKGVVFIRYEKEDQPDVTVAEERDALS